MAVVNTEAKIFNCTNSLELAKKISNSFGENLGNVIISRFSDGEFNHLMKNQFVELESL